MKNLDELIRNDPNEALREAERIYAEVYDPRMLVSEAHRSIAMQRGLSNAYRIVSEIFKTDAPSKLLYLAYCNGYNLKYQAEKSGYKVREGVAI